MSESLINIFLIEDNPADVRLFQEALNDMKKEHMVQFEHRDSLSEGLKRLAQENFDLVVLDLSLPDEQGLTSFLKLHAHFPQLPIIVMTGLDDRNIALEAVKSGAQDYLVKGRVDHQLLSKTVLYAIERKHSEELARNAMKAEQFTIKQILEHAPIGLIRLNKHFHLIQSNETFRKQFQFDLDGIDGQSIFHLLPLLPKEQILFAFGEDRPWQLDNVSFTKPTDDGLKERYFNVTIWPTTDQQGKVNGIIMTTIESTEQVRFRRQKEDLMASLAHDLKTPLIGSDWLIDLILEGTLGEIQQAQKHALTKIKSGHKNMLSHIQNLLEIFHHESDENKLHFQEIDLEVLLSSCSAELTPHAEVRKILIIMDLPDDLPKIWGDYLALRRVFINLLDNAIKFSPVEGSICIVAKRQAGTVSVSIKDQGCGIDKEFIPKIFDRFYSTTPNASSLGLGLYLCKQIVEAHKGNIACQSDKEQGTTFSVSLLTRSEFEDKEIQEKSPQKTYQLH